MPAVHKQKLAFEFRKDLEDLQIKQAKHTLLVAPTIDIFLCLFILSETVEVITK